MTSTLKTLEREILTWQESCLRRFSPQEGSRYQVRVLPVTLSNGRPWLRYGQHWVCEAEQRRPLTCPECTEPSALEKPGACPLCQKLNGDFCHDSAVRLSYLFYCFILHENNTPVMGDRRFRLHQWWMPQRLFDRFSDLARLSHVMDFGAARNLFVSCEDSRLMLDLGDEADLQIPDSVQKRILLAAASPKRRVSYVDLNYETLSLPSFQFNGEKPEY